MATIWVKQSGINCQTVVILIAQVAASRSNGLFTLYAQTS